MTPGAQPTFLGHPRALSTLFFTEMWERFSYYGMRALLVLFLVEAVRNGGFGLDDRTATAIYGLYTASVYIAGLPGGWIADRLIGSQAAVLWGAVLITLGHLVLAIATDLPLFCIGLVVIVMGTGLLKSNIAALVAELYPDDSAGRDAGFTLFYMAINIGALLGPLVTAWLAHRYGWHVGFLAAAVGMALGALQFVLTLKRLGNAGRLPPGRSTAAVTRRDALIVTVLTLAFIALVALIWKGTLSISASALQGGAIYVILAMAVGYFAYLLLFARLEPFERRRVLALLVLFVASSVFWAGFEQAGSSLNLFADRYTDRLVGRFEIPAGWFQALNSSFIIVFAPLFSMLWLWLGRRGRDLSTGGKFVIGLLGMAGGFLMMVAAARVVAAGGTAAPTWLVLTYLFHTWGELALSPVGMSATAQLVPRRFVGQSMGLWYASLSLGNLLASRIAGEFDAENTAAMPAQYLNIVWYGVIAAAVLLAATPLLRRWTADSR